MRSVVFGIVAVLFYTSAHAGSHKVPWASREAPSYLSHCDAPEALANKATCAASQADFVQRYQDAASGDQWAANDVSGQLLGGLMGVKKDVIQGCAWRLVSAIGDLSHAKPDDLDRAIRLCAPAGATGFEVAKARAQQLIVQIVQAGGHFRSGLDGSDPEDD